MLFLRRGERHVEGNYPIGVQNEKGVLTRVNPAFTSSAQAVHEAAGDARKERMGTAKKLSLIAGSYLVAAAAGAAAVLLNRLFTAGDDSGMAAFSDLVLFILVAGLLSLPPTWTLLRRFAERSPRAPLVVVLFVALSSPASWLAASWTPGSDGATAPLHAAFGLAIVFGAIPRIVAAPIVFILEILMLAFARNPVARGSLLAAMSLELVPLLWFALHMGRAA